MFLAFTHARSRLRHRKHADRGQQGAIPSRKLSERANTAAPVIRNMLLRNCISAWATNWFSLSVSLLTREIKSPALFSIEECDRQILQLREQSIAQAEQHAASHAAHGSDLRVTGDDAHQVNRQQYQRRQQQAVSILQADVSIDRRVR